MDDPLLNNVRSLYSDNIKSHGIDSRSVGWKSKESQILRFQKLSSIIDQPANHGLTINDYGCGYGAHLDYLCDDLGLNIVAYNGYDICEEMLSAASRNLEKRNIECNFYHSSEIKTYAHYTFVSGTFNNKVDALVNDWEQYISGKLEEISNFSSAGFSFNLLSTYNDWEDKALYYGNPLKWFDFCKNKFSGYVSLIHDYPLFEWTMHVKNNP